MDIGKNLKLIRQKDLWKQKEVADILGISRSTYSDYETQHKVIPSRYLNVFANHFNVSIDYILGLTDIENYQCIAKDINTSTVAKRIKELRTENKLSQTDLANAINTTQSMIVYYEQGKYLITTSFLYEICKKYHISADYLLGRVDRPKYLNKE